MRRVQDDEPALVLGDDDQPVVGRPRPRFQRQRLAQQADVAAVRVHHRDPLLGIALAGPSHERDEAAVPREHGFPVPRRTRDECPGLAGDRIAEEDVTAGRERDRPVRGRSEWRRKSMTGAHRRHGKGDQDGEDREDRQRSPGRRPCRRSSKCEVHGEPPFGRRPPRPLAPMRRDRKDAFEVVGIGAHREVVEHVRQVAFGERTRAHADVLARSGSPAASSGSSMATRMSRRARWRRDLTVPTGIRRVAATSGSGSPA